MTVLAQRFDVRFAFDDEIGRWSAALLFVLAAHVMLGVLALPRHAEVESSAEPPAAIMVELAAASPTEASPSELPPAPEQVAAPESEPAPIEVELEELSVAALEPAVEPNAEPVHQALAAPLRETVNRDELEPVAEAQPQLEPITESNSERVTEVLNPKELAPSAKAEAETEPQAEAVATLPEMPVSQDFAPSAEVAEETTPAALAELSLELPGTVDLAVSADAPEEPKSAAAEASPETLERVDVQVADVAAEPAIPHDETRAVEADPDLMESLIAAPLPRPRPDIVPEVAEVEPPRPVAQTETSPETERPREIPRRRAAASRPSAPETTSPSPAPNQAQALVAPRAGAAASAPSVSPDRWRSAVYRHLERHKRYPSAAEARRISGTVRVRFTIDKNGNITGHRIVGSSGHAELDQAVSAMIARASPVPAPPPELYRRGMTLEVPVRFSPR